MGTVIVKEEKELISVGRPSLFSTELSEDLAIVGEGAIEERKTVVSEKDSSGGSFSGPHHRKLVCSSSGGANDYSDSSRLHMAVVDAVKKDILRGRDAGQEEAGEQAFRKIEEGLIELSGLEKNLEKKVKA